MSVGTILGTPRVVGAEIVLETFGCLRNRNRGIWRARLEAYLNPRNQRWSDVGKQERMTL